MGAVVLDIKPDGGEAEAQDDGEGQDEPPRVDDEEKEEVGAEEPGEDGGGLEIHARGIAARAAVVFEVGVDAAAEGVEEAVTVGELRELGGGSGGSFRGDDLQRGHE